MPVFARFNEAVTPAPDALIWSMTSRSEVLPARFTVVVVPARLVIEIEPGVPIPSPPLSELKSGPEIAFATLEPAIAPEIAVVPDQPNCSAKEPLAENVPAPVVLSTSSIPLPLLSRRA